MARDVGRTEVGELAHLAGLIVHDTERLLRQHVDLLRSEVRQGLNEIPPAIVSIGAGAGLVAAGGVLGSLMLVHGLHRFSRIPLWGCYGLVGGLLATVGGGLVVSGTRRAAAIRLVPRETMTALHEDLEWLKDQVSLPTS